MKPIYFIKILIVMLLTTSWIGCSSSDDDSVVFKVEPVNNLVATPGDKQIILSWNNPKAEDLSHILISYEDGGKTLTEKVTPNNGDVSSINIPASDMVIYKFIVEAVNKQGEKSEASIVKSKTAYESNSIEYDAILSTVRVMPVGGIKVLWTNIKNLEADIIVSYEVSGVARKLSSKLIR